MSDRKTSTQDESRYSNQLSSEARFFLEPIQPKHRQYEALRAYFAENLPSKEVAARFGYSQGAFHVMCHKFRNDPERKFFVETRPGPKYSPRRDRSRDRVIELRKNNYSIQDIHILLKKESVNLSPASVWKILGHGQKERSTLISGNYYLTHV